MKKRERERYAMSERVWEVKKWDRVELMVYSISHLMAEWTWIWVFLSTSLSLSLAWLQAYTFHPYTSFPVSNNRNNKKKYVKELDFMNPKRDQQQ